MQIGKGDFVPEFKKTILVRKDRFDPTSFKEIAPEANKEIAKATNAQLLALDITMNSPFKVVGAKIYSREVFDNILKG